VRAGAGELLAFHRDDVDLDVGLLRVRSAIVRPGGRVEIGPTKAPTSRWQLRLPAIAVAALLGHASTRVTSAVYRHRRRPPSRRRGTRWTGCSDPEGDTCRDTRGYRVS